MPHHLGKHHEALDRLHALLATVDQVQCKYTILRRAAQPRGSVRASHPAAPGSNLDTHKIHL